MKSIARLLDYRKYFSGCESQLYRWVDTRETDGIIIPGHPQYDTALVRFINEVYDSGLLLDNYEEVLDRQRVSDVDMLINGADMNLLRAILTYYVRGEHSQTGLWGRGVRKKCFLRILNRLSDLRITA